MIIKELTPALESIKPTDMISTGCFLWFFISAFGYYKMFQKSCYTLCDGKKSANLSKINN